MEKIDLRKQLKDFYSPSAKTVSQVDVPPFNYLMIDGHGDPNTSQEYAEAVSALYTLSYTLKFALKKGSEAVDYTVMGLCAQILHIGPYAAEGPTIQKLHAFIAEKGYARRGKHHEIYMGDPRRTAPEKLKTILRQPMEKA